MATGPRRDMSWRGSGSTHTHGRERPSLRGTPASEGLHLLRARPLQVLLLRHMLSFARLLVGQAPARRRISPLIVLALQRRGLLGMRILDMVVDARPVVVRSVADRI